MERGSQSPSLLNAFISDYHSGKSGWKARGQLADWRQENDNTPPVSMVQVHEDVEFEPGLVNVFIGANGNGKSNLLEALGVLSAAIQGRVDYAALLRRGVRPGLPAMVQVRILRHETKQLHLF